MYNVWSEVNVNDGKRTPHFSKLSGSPCTTSILSHPFAVRSSLAVLISACNGSVGSVNWVASVAALAETVVAVVSVVSVAVVSFSVVFCIEETVVCAAVVSAVSVSLLLHAVAPRIIANVRMRQRNYVLCFMAFSLVYGQTLFSVT